MLTIENVSGILFQVGWFFVDSNNRRFDKVCYVIADNIETVLAALDHLRGLKIRPLDNEVLIIDKIIAPTT